jgi:hypothetical protein
MRKTDGELQYRIHFPKFRRAMDEWLLRSELMLDDAAEDDADAIARRLAAKQAAARETDTKKAKTASKGARAKWSAQSSPAAGGSPSPVKKTKGTRVLADDKAGETDGADATASDSSQGKRKRAPVARSRAPAGKRAKEEEPASEGTLASEVDPPRTEPKPEGRSTKEKPVSRPSSRSERGAPDGAAEKKEGVQVQKERVPANKARKAGRGVDAAASTASEGEASDATLPTSTPAAPAAAALDPAPIVASASQVSRATGGDQGSGNSDVSSSAGNDRNGKAPAAEVPNAKKTAARKEAATKEAAKAAKKEAARKENAKREVAKKEISDAGAALQEDTLPDQPEAAAAPTKMREAKTPELATEGAAPGTALAPEAEPALNAESVNGDGTEENDDDTKREARNKMGTKLGRGRGRYATVFEVDASELETVKRPDLNLPMDSDV